jgi:hypothetical protein
VFAEAAIVPTEGTKVVRWEVLPGKPKRLVVAASDSAELKGYEDYIRQLYSTVVVEKINWDVTSGWTLSLLLSDRKKP